VTGTVVEVLVPGLWRASGQDPGQPTPTLLARMLGRGHLGGSGSPAWEAALAARLGFRRGLSGRRCWLALPVALAAGMTDLVASRVEDLTPEEWDALRSVLLPELEHSGATLRETIPGLPVLELDGEGDWEGPPPSAGLGRPLRVPRLNSEVARRLQVLANSVQMLWFEHPVNRERAGSGRLPVQGLWFWSPGVPPAVPSASRVAGGGSVARWLADAAGAAWSGDPFDPDAELIVVDVFAREVDASRYGGLLESLCADVLAPQLTRLRRGRASELHVHDPGTALLRLEPADWRRFWRRGRPLHPPIPRLPFG
jgi:hypothetical protein